MAEITLNIHFKASDDFTLLSDVAAKAVALARRGVSLPQDVLEVLRDFAEGVRNIVGDVERRPTAAGDIELSVGPKITVGDRVLLAAFRARDFGGHGNSSSLVGVATPADAESGEAHKASPGEVEEGP